MSSRPKTILILSQVFIPDPASVGQHIAAVAFELAKRGHYVRVYCSASGYEDATLKYPARETIRGVDVRRLPFASFGKKSILLRILGTLTFTLQAFICALFTPKLGAIFFSTSPPMIGVVSTIVAILRRVPRAYWAMDLNPDQLVALGKLKQTSLSVRTLEFVNQQILRYATLTIALDRFMADRLNSRGTMRGKLVIIPPWPHEEHEGAVPHADNPFRAKHAITDKFVVMYSGNHSPSNPLKTILEAAVRLKNHERIRFIFVGGGAGKQEVETYIRDHNLQNAVSLPYQPMSDLRFSLSAADVHVVSLGPSMVGIIHPCKVYGAMAVSRPILFLGPRPSHIADLLDQHSFGHTVPHGDIDAAERAILKLFETPRDELDRMGTLGATLLRSNLSTEILCNKLCDELEIAFGMPSGRTAETRAESNVEVVST